MKLRTKLLFIILFVTVLSLACVYVSAFHFTRTMREGIVGTVDASTREAVDELSAMQKRTLTRKLLRVATANANFMDNCLGEWRRQTNIFAGLTTDIYNNPEKYLSRHISPPRRGGKGLTAQLLFSREDADRDALADEIGKAANILDYLMSLFANSPIIDHATLAMESGFLFDVDTLADHKFSDPDAVEPALFFALERPWYKRTKAEGAFCFSDAFIDFFTGELIVSGAAPVFRDGRFAGVACLSFLLADLRKQVMKTAVDETGYGFIFNDKARVFISPKESGDTAVDRSLVTSDNPGLAKAVRAILAAGESGVVETIVDGREVYLAYCPLEYHDWFFATVIDKAEMDVAIRGVEDELTVLSREIHAAIMGGLRRFRYVLLGLVGFGALLAFLASQLAASWFAKPIRKLVDGARRIGQGDLDVTLDVGSRDEMGMLAGSFNKMTDDLKRHMRELSEAVAEKQRISTELEVANQIQTNMLPNAFPPLHGFEPNSAYDIFATMKPAKEVGGDMYDFFVIDQDRLGLVIADVCGKGIPAALFMVVVKTLVKNQALHCQDPAKVFEIVNDRLCEDNSASMFATALFAVFDFRTMRLTYANAGHPLLLIRRTGGEFEPDVMQPDPPLGSIDGIPYTGKTLELDGGATLFFYTDGVTEAQNRDETLFSEEQLLDLLRTRVPQDALPRDIIALVEREVVRFTGDCEAYDDMTMLAFKVVPNADRRQDAVTPPATPGRDIRG